MLDALAALQRRGPPQRGPIDALAGCAGMLLAMPAAAQQALAPAGPQAAHIAGLWQLMGWICGAVFVAILAATAFVMWRTPRADPSTPPDAAPVATRERAATRAVGAAVTLSIAGLVLLIGASIATDRALARLPLTDALHIELTAHQWWWEARYDDADAARVFSTANELHLPRGRPVLLTLRASDVIHSLWVPPLHGKKDLIPGRTATLQLRADVEGEYRGQCAEFCGLQHAAMALRVMVVAPDRFESWAARQRADAAEPQAADAVRGRAIFLSSTCAMCHRVQGSGAEGRRGPDLTHLAQRRTLAAGRLPNDAASLAAWLRDPQRVKPGAHMPASELPDDELRAVVAYLAQLR